MTRTLATYIVIFSAAVVALTTAVQLYLDYSNDVRGIEARLGDVERSHLPSVAHNLWIVDTEQLQLIADQLAHLPDVRAAEIRQGAEPLAKASSGEVRGSVSRRFPIVYDTAGRSVELGSLQVTATLEGVRRRLRERMLVILGTNAVTTAAVALFIFYVVNHHVTEPLAAIARHLRKLDARKAGGALVLQPRRRRRRPVPDELDDVARSINAVHADLAQAYRSLETALGELQAASRTKDEFLFMLSHELRAPLNAVIGWSRLLSDGKLDRSGVARACLSIERSVQVQTRLIEDLLDNSRLMSGKLRLESAVVDLRAVAEAAVESARFTADERGVALELEVPASAPFVRGDAQRLQQVLSNLLSNALKFTLRGGSARLRLEERPEEVRLVVQDTGVGIEPSFLPYVFDRFRQAEAAMSPRHGGLGLGLAIVRELVQLHGGTVQAESPGAGRGSTFTVVLPRLHGVSAAAPARLAAPEGGPRGLRDVRVLLVDDDADSREVVELMLEGRGAQVRSLASGREALAELEAFRPDVLVSDIGMPDLDGYALVRQLRGREPGRGAGVPAIALTAYATALEGDRALAAGFQLHLAKPVDPDRLAAAISSVVGRSLTGRQAEGVTS